MMMGNKICLITGCNSGIGKVSAIELAKKEFEIIMLVRDSEKSRIAYEEIKSASGAKPIIYLASSEDLDDTTGKYFYKNKPKEIDKIVNDPGLLVKIWVKTEELTGIKR